MGWQPVERQASRRGLLIAPRRSDLRQARRRKRRVRRPRRRDGKCGVSWQSSGGVRSPFGSSS